MNEFRYDALLVLTYGGPESPDDVPLYLERLFAGKSSSPRARERGKERYALIGGKSPIMGQARDFAAALYEEFDPLPVYLGCLYASPLLEESLRVIADAGHRRVLVLITSPFGIEGVRLRYTERLESAAHAAPKAEFFLAPPFYAHPKWVRAQADRVLSLLAEETLESIRWEREEVSGASVLLFTAHSLPLTAAGGYPDELRKSCLSIAAALAPRAIPWYQSIRAGADRPRRGSGRTPRLSFARFPRAIPARPAVWSCRSASSSRIWRRSSTWIAIWPRPRQKRT